VKALGQAKVLDEVQGRLGRLRPESIRVWGKMSPQEMVCHLADSFELALGERTNPQIRLPLPPGVIMVLALRVPLRWGRNIPTAPVVKQGVGGSLPKSWNEDMERLQKKLKAFCEKRGEWPEHPFFRSMETRDWLRWGYLHMDHHLRQFGC